MSICLGSLAFFNEVIPKADRTIPDPKLAVVEKKML
jgi:hypothetical protein